MKYKEFIPKHGEKLTLSRLGMGNMRLPTIGEGRDAPIDEKAATEIIDYAFASGINYYDTAYVYHGGESEKFLGRALIDRYPREKFYIATKYNRRMSGADFAGAFEEQLRRLHTDYIDFYLLHAVNDDNADDYLQSGCIEYFEEQRKKGRIRYLGFSSHSSPEVLQKVASFYDWDFAQIQLNYLDWTLTRAKEQYEILTSHNIPVMVMEPIRGGRLASLNEKANAFLKEANPDWSVPSWALRWVQRLPNVQVVLSGMSSLSQIKDNVKTFSDPEEMTDAQAETLMKACEMFRNDIAIPCTACRYCVDGCPQQIDIPAALAVYNAYKLDGNRALKDLKEPLPTACIACGQCVSNCPQSIDIPTYLAELGKLL